MNESTLNKILHLLKNNKRLVVFTISLLAIFVLSMWGKQNGGLYIIILLILYLYEKNIFSILNRVKKIGVIELSSNIDDAIELAPYQIKDKIKRNNTRNLSDEDIRLSFIKKFRNFEKEIRERYSPEKIVSQYHFVTLQQIITYLVKRQEIDPYILSSYMDIRYIRNAITHGQDNGIPRDTIIKSLELLDIMIDLLKEPYYPGENNI